MKSIKTIIKINPETLHEKEVLKIIQLRLMDVSSSTREATLDLLWQSLTQLNYADEDKTQSFQTSFVKKYLAVIVERADDTSLGVRKLVVKLLSHILQISSTNQQYTQSDIIRILIKKWDDQNEQLRANMISTLKRIFTQIIIVIHSHGFPFQSILVLRQVVN